MKVTYVSGSTRKSENSNSDYLLNLVREETGGQLIKLEYHSFHPCCSCWKCREEGRCVITDDLTEEVFPEILESNALVLGSPVYQNVPRKP